MTWIRDLFLIGLVASAGRWLYANRADFVDWLTTAGLVLAVAVGALLALRILVGFARGVARGFREAWAREPGANERREMVERLASDMRDVRDRWIDEERKGAGYSPR